MTVMAIIAMEYDMEPRTLGFSELNTIPSRNIAFYLLSRLRNAPSQTLHHSTCPLLRTITVGSDSEFKQAFRVSRAVFSALLSELAPYLRDGYSRNGSQNLSAELKLGVAMFFFAHGGSGQHLKMASGLSASTARKYIFLVADLICKKLASKFMGDAILNADDAYIEKCRTRFHARHGFPKVAGCIDGTHIPYKPNNGEFEADYKNYKQWTSLLCIAFVNSYHLFVDIDVGWPGRWHDKTCSDNSYFWLDMHRQRGGRTKPASSEATVDFP